MTTQHRCTPYLHTVSTEGGREAGREGGRGKREGRWKGWRQGGREGGRIKLVKVQGYIVLTLSISLCSHCSAASHGCFNCWSSISTCCNTLHLHTETIQNDNPSTTAVLFTKQAMHPLNFPEEKHNRRIEFVYLQNTKLETCFSHENVDQCKSHKI